MMLIRGSLETLVRTIQRENETLLRKTRRLAEENAVLRGQRDEMYKTLGRK